MESPQDGTDTPSEHRHPQDDLQHLKEGVEFIQRRLSRLEYRLVDELSAEAQTDYTLEETILEAILYLENETGKAHTLDIAAHISLSRAQTYRYLKQLEEAGQVIRIGKKGGWRLARY